MANEQPELPTAQRSPGEPGTWWRDDRGGRTVMRRVPIPGESLSTWEPTPVSSPETRVAR